MREILSTYYIGDMKLIYYNGINRKGYNVVGYTLIPLVLEDIVVVTNDDIEPLIQVKIIGDDYPFNYSQGRTMRNSETTFNMHYVKQYIQNDIIVTELKDERGINYKHYVKYTKSDLAIEVFCEIRNESSQKITVEMISSFTLGELTPFTYDEASETIKLYQIRSTWANEGRLVSTPIEDFQLEPSWKPSGTNCIRFGQVGSMPNREYFPFVGIEDTKNKVCWAFN